jgi:hypothetical protein
VAQPKVIATLVVAVVLAVVAFLLGQPLLAAVVVVVGLVGAFLVLRSAGGTLRRGGSDDFIEVDDAGWDDTPAAPTGRGGGLATWNPGATTDAEPLSTWSPGGDAAEPLTAWEPTAAPEAPEEPLEAPRAGGLFSTPAPSPTDQDDGPHHRSVGNGAGTLRPFEAEPLAPWDEGGAAAPEVDEQAEIDRAARVLAGDDAGSIFEPPINEAVSTADDIMAASEATELHIGSGPAQGDDGELAKLLAKVQARLAAYE